MKKIKIIVMVMIITVLNGCTNISDDLKPSDINMENEITNNDIEGLDFGSKFDVKNLLIKDFTKKVYDDCIIYKLEYILSEKTYKFTQDTNLEYYFYLEYPKEITEIIGEEKTELIKGKNRSKDNDICTIEFKQDIKKEIVNKIKNTDLKNYNLVITNREYYPVTIFNDIKSFISIDESSRFFNID